jgi:hypothetical protein
MSCRTSVRPSDSQSEMRQVSDRRTANQKCGRCPTVGQPIRNAAGQWVLLSFPNQLTIEATLKS